MNKDLLYPLIFSTAANDSKQEQQQAVELAVFLMRIHKQVRQQGIGILEDVPAENPLLARGFALVRMGMEPELVERVLLTSLVFHSAQLRQGLLVIEGILAIQTGQSLEVTKELLKAYLPFVSAEQFEQKLRENEIISSSSMLSQKEVSRLLREKK